MPAHGRHARRRWQYDPSINQGELSTLTSLILKVARAPRVFAPIDGEYIGRVRLRQNSEDEYTGCSNDGIVIVGTGKWASELSLIFTTSSQITR